MSHLLLLWTVPYTFHFVHEMWCMYCANRKNIFKAVVLKKLEKILLFACKPWYFPPVYLSKAFEAAIKNNFKIFWVWNLIFQEVLRAKCSHKDLLGKKGFLLSVTFTTLQGWKNFRLQVMIFINIQFLWYICIYTYIYVHIVYLCP